MQRANVDRIIEPSSLWSFEAAFNLLQEDPQSHNKECLAQFFDLHQDSLNTCYNQSQKSSTKTNESTSLASTSASDVSSELSKALNISVKEALRIIKLNEASGSIPHTNESSSILIHAAKYFKERRYLCQIVSTLFRLRAQPSSRTSWKYVSTKILTQKDFFPGLVEQIKGLFFVDEGLLTTLDTPLTALILKENLLFHINLLSLLLISIRYVIPQADPIISNWIKVVRDTDCFSVRFVSPDIDQRTIQTVQALASTCTVLLLDLEQDFGSNANPHSYINKPEIVIEIHKIIRNSLFSKPSGSQILFAWGLVLQNIAVRLETQHIEGFNKFPGVVTVKDPQINAANVPLDINRISQELVLQALSLGVLQDIENTLKLLPKTLEYYGTFYAVIESSLLTVTVTDQLSGLIYEIISRFDYLTSQFVKDTLGIDALILARSKVPLALDTFLNLAKAIGIHAYEYVNNMPNYLQQLPSSFRHFELTSGIPPVIKLKQELWLFEPREEDGMGGIVLPIGTRGQVLSSSSTPDSSAIVMWNYDFNGWSFLARVVERAHQISSQDPHIVKIIDLFSSTLSSLNANSCLDLLASCSLGVQCEDIVELIANILDESLYTKNSKLSGSCIRFLTVVVSIDSIRVWPYMGRTRLLEWKGEGDFLSSILGSIEIVSGDFAFTLSVIDLASSLARVSIWLVVGVDELNRFKSEVIFKLVKHLIEVFESFGSWRYTETDQQIRIAAKILSLFSFILRSVYKVEEDVAPQEKVTGVLARAADLLVANFLNPKDNGLRTIFPLIRAVETTARSTDDLDSVKVLESSETTWLQICLNFCSLAIRVRSEIKDSNPSLLEHKLFHHSSDLAVIYARYSKLHTHVLKIWTDLVSADWQGEPPSLLAYLGTDGSEMMIRSISNSVTNDLETSATQTQACELFSAIMEGKQEGLSIILISGKDSRRKAISTSQPSSSLLQILHSKAIRIASLPSSLSIQLLDCIALAHSSWSLSSSNGSDELFDTLFKQISESVKIQNESSDPLEQADSNGITCNAIKIVAIEMMRQPTSRSSQKFLNILKEKKNLYEYSKAFLEVQGYRSSLHINLQRNFDSKWPKSKLSKFIRSNLESNQLGSSCFFDLALMDQAFTDHPEWKGFRVEIVQANTNISFIHSQIELVSSWCSLLTSMVHHAVKSDKDLLALVRPIGAICVDANLSQDLAIDLFTGIVESRMELAFFIMFSLSNASLTATSREDLTKIFNLLAEPELGFLASLSGTNTGLNLKLYKYLLRMLILGLSDLQKESRSTGLLNLLQGIFEVVVIKGMTALTVSVTHSRNNAGQGQNTGSNDPEDMFLIIMILHKCLEIKAVSALYPTLEKIMAENDCDRSVMYLFSYSQDPSNSTLEAREEDPFGQLALIYLLEWLSVDIIADRLIVNGLLGLVEESYASREIQDGGVSPVERPNLFGLWTKGILPIILQLLKQIGRRIIPEVIVFLKFFKLQIEFSLRSWFSPASISLGNVEETTQILLLLNIVHNLASEEQRQLLPHLDFNTEDLGEAFDYLMTHPRYLNSKLLITTSEEQKLANENAEKVNDEEGPVSKYLQRITADISEMKSLLGET